MHLALDSVGPYGNRFQHTWHLRILSAGTLPRRETGGAEWADAAHSARRSCNFVTVASVLICLERDARTRRILCSRATKKIVNTLASSWTPTLQCMLHVCHVMQFIHEFFRPAEGPAVAGASPLDSVQFAQHIQS